MHLVPDKTVPGHFNVLRGAFRAPINLAGVKVIGDYVDNYKQGLPSELGLLLLMDPANWRAEGDHRRQPSHRHAHGRGHRHRREASRAQGIEDSRARGRARHGLLERTPARPAVRLRRDQGALAPAREPGRLRRPSRARSRQAGEGDAGLARLRRGRRYRRRGIAAHRAGADAQDRVDQDRRLRRTLWHDERGRALAHRYHGQDRRRRLGSMQSRPARRAARARGGGQALGGDAARARWARSSPGKKPGASERTRPSCSGTAACRFRISRWVARCSTRRRGSASGNGCAMLDAGARPPGAALASDRRNRMHAECRASRSIRRPIATTRRSCADSPATASKRLRSWKRQGSMMPEPQAESHWRVSLPMYNLPEMQAVNADFWDGDPARAAAAGHREPAGRSRLRAPAGA